MKLNDLKPDNGSVKSKKRIGRGHGSGLGKTSGRGHKGAGQRSAAAVAYTEANWLVREGDRFDRSRIIVYYVQLVGTLSALLLVPQQTRPRCRSWPHWSCGMQC